MSKGKLDESSHEGREKKTRWSAAVARAMLGEAEASGESLAAFAMRKGFDPQRLRLWKKKLGNTVPPRREAEFLPVRVADSEPKIAARTASFDFELVLANGRMIRVGKDFDPRSLCRLVEALEQGPR